MGKVKLKKGFELPPNIQEFCDRVNNTPLNSPSFGQVLSEFRWEYDKGDFYHWVPLFNRFEDFFTEQIKPRQDLQLKDAAQFTADPPFPVENCLQVLRVTSILLENCSNKHVYASYEHLGSLLAAPHAEVVAAALQSLLSFLKKTHHAHIRWHGYKDLNTRLNVLAQGWGGKEEGLDLLSCVSEDQRTIQQNLAKATTLKFDFFQEFSSAAQQPAGVAGASGKVSIVVRGVDKLPQSDHGLLAELVQRYQVDEQHRFSLLCKIRQARSFATLESRRLLVFTRLISFVVFAQSSPSPEAMSGLYAAEPEMILELVALVQTEAPGLEWLRALAVRALGVQVQDRARYTAVIAGISGGAGQGSGLLSVLLHKAVAAFIACGTQPPPSPSPRIAAPSPLTSPPASASTAAAGAAAAAAPTESATPSQAAAGPGLAQAQQREQRTAHVADFLDAMLTLVSTLVQSTAGCQVLTDAGVLQALLPLLQDKSPEHLGVVATTVKVMELYMDFSQSASTIFRDLNGLQEMIKRLAYEVGLEGTKAASAPSQAPSTPPTSLFDADIAPSPSPPPSGPPHSAPTAAVAQAAAAGAEGAKASKPPPLAYSRKVLIKFLLRAVAISSYAPTSGVASRPQDADATLLYRCLRAMFEQAERFGGSLFALAAGVVTDLLHHEPLSYRALEAEGLPAAFIVAIKVGVLPFGEALISIPNTIVALCLNTHGLELVRTSRVMDCLVPIFTQKQYLKALGGETPAALGAGIEELFRFTPALRPEGMDAVVNVFRALCIIGGDVEEVQKAEAAMASWKQLQERLEQDKAAAAARAAEAADAAQPTAAAPAPEASTGEEAAATPMETEQQPPEQQQQQQQAAGAGEESQPHTATAAGGTVGQPQQAGTGDQDVEMAGPPAPEGEAQPEQGVSAAAVQPASDGAAAAAAAAPGSTAEGAGAAAGAASTAPPTPQPFDFSAELAEFRSGPSNNGSKEQGTSLAHLPEAISHATRMLDTLLNNAETAKMFVEKGGLDLLLKLHTLPRLVYTFGFSASSHAMLTVFRSLAPHHAQVLANKTSAALSAAVDATLAHTEPLGSVCVPCMPAPQREVYVKQVSSMAGIVSLASAVARNATQMLPLIATGASPVLARVGRLERALLQQAAVSDAWAGAREVAERTAAIALERERVVKGAKQQPGATAPAAGTAASHGPGQEPQHAGPAAAAAAPVVTADTAGGGAEVAMDEEGQVEDMVEETVAARDEDGGDMMTDNVQVARLPGSHTTTSGAGAIPVTGAGSPTGGANASTSIKFSGRKKTPEELSADIIHHTAVILRSLYVSVAKSIHTPARRRDDTSGHFPNMGMRAAALGLATIVKGSLDVPLPHDVPRDVVEAGANAGVQTAVQLAATTAASATSGGASAPAPSEGGGAEGGSAGGTGGGGGAGASVGAGGGSEESNRGGPEAMVVEGSTSAAAAAASPGPAPAVAAGAASADKKEEPEQLPACVHGIAQRVVAAHGSLPLLHASGHLSRVADSAYMVLFDVRRRSCHSLVLNYFVALGGLPSLAARFSQSADAVWAAMDATAAREEQAAAAKATNAGGSGASGEERAAGALGQPPSSGGGDVVMAEGEGAAPAAATPAVATAGAREAPLAQASKRDPRMLAEKAMQSFLSAYELMSNATLVFSSSQAATFLPLPLPGAAGPAAASQIKDPAALVRAIQTSAVSAVSAVWRHEKLPSAPPAIMSQVVSVLNNCAEGTATAAAVLLRQRAGGVGLGRPMGFQPDSALVQAMVDMGFPRNRVELALRRVGVNSIEAATEWLLAHPEEPPAAPAAAAAAAAAGAGAAPGPAPPARSEDEELDLTLSAMLSAIGLGPEQLLQAGAARPETPAAAPPAAAAATVTAAEGTAAPPAAAAAPGGVPAPPAPVAATATPRAEGGAGPSAMTSLMGVTATVEGAVSIMARSPAAATVFSMGDLLFTLAVREKEEGHEGGTVVGELLRLFRGTGSASEQVMLHSPTMLMAARLLLVVLSRDLPSREIAASKGLIPKTLELLEAWHEQYKAAARALTLDVPKEQAARTLEVPVWVEAALLLLDCQASTITKTPPSLAAAEAAPTRSTQPAAEPGSAAPAAAPGSGRPSTSLGAGAGANQAEDRTERPASGGSNAGASGPSSAAAAGVTSHRGGAAGTSGGAVGNAGADKSAAAAPADKTTAVLQAALSEASKLWRACGMLDDAEQARALSVTISLLRSLQLHADKWAPSPSIPLKDLMAQGAGTVPNPASCTQAVLQLLTRLTKKHANAQVALTRGCHRMLLSLPAACYAPSFVLIEPHVCAVLRHMMEDPATLESLMESEIRNFFVQKARPDSMNLNERDRNVNNVSNRSANLSSFISNMSHVLAREPAIFVEAVAHSCALEVSGMERILRLRRPNDAPFGGRSSHHEYSSQQHQQQQQQQDTPMGAPAGGAEATTNTPSSRRSEVRQVQARAAEQQQQQQQQGQQQGGARVRTRVVPPSFVDVVDMLVEVIMAEPSAPPTQQQQPQQAGPSEMEVETARAAQGQQPGQQQQQQGQEGRGLPQQHPLLEALKSSDALVAYLRAYPPQAAAQAMALRMLTDAVLLFGSSVGLLMKRDVELWLKEQGAAPAATAPTPITSVKAAKNHVGQSPSGQQQQQQQSQQLQQPPQQQHEKQHARAGAIVKTLLHRHLVSSDAPLVTTGIAERAAHLLQAICVRSVEGRRRIISEVATTLAAGVKPAPPSAAGHPTEAGQPPPASPALTSAAVIVAGGPLPGSCPNPGGQVDELPPPSPSELRVALAPVQGVSPAAGAAFVGVPGRPAPAKVRAFVSLVSSLLASAANQKGTPPTDPRRGGAAAPGALSAEMVRCMRELGVVKALATALRQVNLEHPRATKSLSGILKPLDVLTRNLGALSAQAIRQQQQQQQQAAPGAGEPGAPHVPSTAAQPRTGAAGATPTTERPAAGSAAAAPGAAASTPSAPSTHRHSRQGGRAGGAGAGGAEGAHPPGTAASTPAAGGLGARGAAAGTPSTAGGAGPSTSQPRPETTVHVEETPAGGMQTEAGPAAMQAADLMRGGHRRPRHRSQHVADMMGGDSEDLEDMDDDDDILDGESGEEEDDDEEDEDEGEDGHHLGHHDHDPFGEPLELPGGVLHAMGHGSDSDSEMGDESSLSRSASEGPDAEHGEGEEDASLGQGEAHGDIEPDDDEVLDDDMDSMDEGEEEDVFHQHHHHDPHGVVVNVEGGEHGMDDEDDEIGLEGGEEDDEEGEEEGEEDEEDDMSEEERRMRSDPYGDEEIEEDEIIAQETEDLEEDGMDEGRPHAMLRRPTSLIDRFGFGREAAMAGGAGGIDGDTAGGFGAVAELPDEVAQTLSSTVSRLLGEAGVSGLMSTATTAARPRHGMPGGSRFRIIARDPHGRQVALEQGPNGMLVGGPGGAGGGGPGMGAGGGAGAPSTPAPHRLLARPPPAMGGSGTQQPSMSMLQQALMRGDLLDDVLELGGRLEPGNPLRQFEVLLAMGINRGMPPPPGLDGALLRNLMAHRAPPVGMAALGAADLLGGPTGMQGQYGMPTLLNEEEGFERWLATGEPPPRAAGGARATGPVDASSEGAVDTRALEQTLFNMLRQQQEPQGPEDQGNAGGGAGDRRGPPGRAAREIDPLDMSLDDLINQNRYGSGREDIQRSLNALEQEDREEPPSARTREGGAGGSRAGDTARAGGSGRRQERRPGDAGTSASAGASRDETQGAAAVGREGATGQEGQEAGREQGGATGQVASTPAPAAATPALSTGSELSRAMAQALQAALAETPVAAAAPPPPPSGGPAAPAPAAQQQQQQQGGPLGAVESTPQQPTQPAPLSAPPPAPGQQGRGATAATGDDGGGGPSAHVTPMAFHLTPPPSESRPSSRSCEVEGGGGGERGQTAPSGNQQQEQQQQGEPGASPMETDQQQQPQQQPAEVNQGRSGEPMSTEEPPPHAQQPDMQPPVSTGTAAAAAAAAPPAAPPSGAAPQQQQQQQQEQGQQQQPPGSSLDERLRGAAQSAGIDLTFLEALPEELRAEVLSMHGAELAGGVEGEVVGAPALPGVVAPAEETAEMGLDPEFLAALPPEIQAEVLQQQRTERRRAQDAQRREQALQRQRQEAQQQAQQRATAAAATVPAPGAAAPPAANATETTAAAAAAAAGGGAGGEGAVAAAPAGATATPAAPGTAVTAEGPADSAAAAPAAAAGGAGPSAGGDGAGPSGEGAPPPPAGAAADEDMDLASLIATFPPDVREDVLLTSDEGLLQTLPPAILAEARSLRARYRTTSLGEMPILGVPGGGRGGGLAPPPGTIAAFSTPGGRGGRGGGRNSAAAQAALAYQRAAAISRRVHQEEEDNTLAQVPPMLDLEDLGSLAALLRVSHPNSSRQALLRVLLNLSAHAPTRRALLRMLLGTVRALTEGQQQQPATRAASDAMQVEQQQQQQQEVLQAGQAAISAMLGVNAISSAAVPQLLRRVLETVTYMAKHSSLVARMILTLRVPFDGVEQLTVATTAMPSATAAPPQAPAQTPALAGSLAPSVPTVQLLPPPDAHQQQGAGAAAPSQQGQQGGTDTQPALSVQGGGEPGSLEVMLTSVGMPLCKRSNPTMELALHLLETELKAAAAYLTELSTRLQMVGEERASERGKAEAAAPPTTTTTQAPHPPDNSQQQQQQQQQAMDTDQPQDQQQQAPPQQQTDASQREQPGTAPYTAAPSATPTPGPSTTTPTPPTPASTTTPAAAASGAAGATPSTPAPATSAAAAAAGTSAGGNGGGGGFGSPITAPSAPTPQAGSGAGAPPPSARTAALDATEAKLLAAQQEARSVLQGLPPKLVRQLAGLLSEEGLSDTTYARASTSVRTLVDVAPPHLPTVLDELRSGVQRLAHTLSAALNAAHASPAALNADSADSALLGNVASQGGMVLRSLSALQAFRKAQQGRAAQAQQAKQLQQEREQAAHARAADRQRQQQQLTGGAGPSAGPAGQPSATAGAVRPATPVATASPSDTRTPSTAPHPPTNASEQKQQQADTAEEAAAAASAAEALRVCIDAVAQALEPLWQVLSVVMTRIEEQLKGGAAANERAGGPGAAAAAAAAAAAERDQDSSAKLLPPGAQQVLPLVESFLVTCSLQDAVPEAPSENTPPPLQQQPSVEAASLLDSARPASPSLQQQQQQQEAGASSMDTDPQRQQQQQDSQSGSSAPANSAAGHLQQSQEDQYAAFNRFAERHKRLLNAYVHRTPSLLESSFAPLLRAPKLLDFDNKRAYFRTKVRQHDNAPRPYGSLRISVRREHVFEDSFHQLRSRTPEEMHMKLNVTFQGEEGIDAGGVSREWYAVMAQEIFNPNLALFVQVPEQGTTFQPNPNSVVQSDRGVDHLDYFRFVGRVVGKALYDGQLFDAYFTRSFYKHMLGQALTYEDIEGVDPGYYKNLVWMLENDITDVLSDLTFTAESDFFGRKELQELIPGGSKIQVTEANKRQYVDLIARHHMTTSIKQQINAFLEGFWELVPRHLISIFNDHELELLISGLPDIDVADLRANTEYQGYNPNTPVVRWFFEVLSELSKEDLALMIQFITGTSKVPLEGFKALQGIGGPQKFQIHKAYGPPGRLPSAHTCFNQLDLPEYESKEVLRERLLMACHEGATGFGFV